MNILGPLAGIGFGMIFFFMFAIFLLPQIFFLLTLQRTFEAISPENRLMNPGEVWLNLIPIFGLIWIFIIVQRLADSLQKEFNMRGISYHEPRPGYNIGIAYAAVNAATMLIPFIGIASLVLWIVYWIKVAEFKGMLEGDFGRYTN